MRPTAKSFDLNVIITGKTKYKKPYYDVNWDEDYDGETSYIRVGIKLSPDPCNSEQMISSFLKDELVVGTRCYEDIVRIISEMLKESLTNEKRERRPSEHFN